jgi:hypothetical protein
MGVHDPTWQSLDWWVMDLTATRYCIWLHFPIYLKTVLECIDLEVGWFVSSLFEFFHMESVLGLSPCWTVFPLWRDLCNESKKNSGVSLDLHKLLFFDQQTLLAWRFYISGSCLWLIKEKTLRTYSKRVCPDMARWITKSDKVSWNIYGESEAAKPGSSARASFPLVAERAPNWRGLWRFHP